jgi:hypothetical protein
MAKKTAENKRQKLILGLELPLGSFLLQLRGCPRGEG